MRCGSFRRTSPVDEISFDVEISPDTACRGVAGELQQVCVNLLKNAVDAVLTGTGTLGAAWDSLSASKTMSSPRQTMAAASRPTRCPSCSTRSTTKPPGQRTDSGQRGVRIVTKHRGDIQVQSVLGGNPLHAATSRRGQCRLTRGGCMRLRARLVLIVAAASTVPIGVLGFGASRLAGQELEARWFRAGTDRPGLLCTRERGLIRNWTLSDSRREACGVRYLVMP